MFIDSETKLRVNIYAPYKGFSKLDTQEIRAKADVIEIAEPEKPADYSEDLYYRTEQDAAPYVVYTRKSDEQIAVVMLQKAKAQRQASVDSLKVTTSSNKEFDGDELSQDRMNKAIKTAEITGLTQCEWVLANNKPTIVTLDELKEAFAKAFQAMGAVWSAPYKQ